MYYLIETFKETINFEKLYKIADANNSNILFQFIKNRIRHDYFPNGLNFGRRPTRYNSSYHEIVKFIRCEPDPNSLQAALKEIVQMNHIKHMHIYLNYMSINDSAVAAIQNITLDTLLDTLPNNECKEMLISNAFIRL
jgi:hypothetical protein